MNYNLTGSFMGIGNNEVSDIVIWQRSYYNSMPYNLQYNFHLIFINEGKAVLSFLGEDYNLTQGDMAVIFPMAAFSFAEFEGSKYTFLTCSTDVLLRSIRPIIKGSRPLSPIIKAADLADSVKNYLEQLLHLNKNLCKAITYENDSASLPYKITKNQKIDNVNMKKIDNIEQRFYQSEENVFYYANTIVNMIVAECLKTITLIPENKNSRQELSFKIIAFISEHYKEDISLDTIATSFNINKFTISRVLSKDLGYSFYEILNNLRVSEAKDLLTRTNESIINIAYDVGYNYLYTFDRIFKKLVGISPKD